MPHRSIFFSALGLLASIAATLAVLAFMPVVPLLALAFVPCALAVWQLQHRFRLSVDVAIAALFDGHAFPAPQTGVLPRTAFV